MNNAKRSGWLSMGMVFKASCRSRASTLAMVLVGVAAHSLGCSADGSKIAFGGGSGGIGTGGSVAVSSGSGGMGGDVTIDGGLAGSGGFSSSGTPVRSLPGLESITFYERSGGSEPTPYTFAVNGVELTTRLADPLQPGNIDIPGASTEFYDVYYSDVNGAFDINGSYLTITGVYQYPFPAGGGLNLAEISLNFAGTAAEYGNYVASYVTLGDNSIDAAVPNCIDGDLQTHTTMGNTAGSSERLRLTLGFLSTSGPPPK